MNITPQRLRELIAYADDRAGDIALPYQTLQNYRDIAAALRALQDARAELELARPAQVFAAEVHDSYVDCLEIGVDTLERWLVESGLIQAVDTVVPCGESCRCVTEGELEAGEISLCMRNTQAMAECWRVKHRLVDAQAADREPTPCT